MLCIFFMCVCVCLYVHTLYMYKIDHMCVFCMCVCVSWGWGDAMCGVCVASNIYFDTQYDIYFEKAQTAINNSGSIITDFHILVASEDCIYSISKLKEKVFLDFCVFCSNS